MLRWWWWWWWWWYWWLYEHLLCTSSREEPYVGTSQWQLSRANLWIRGDPVRSSRMRLWKSGFLFYIACFLLLLLCLFWVSAPRWCTYSSGWLLQCTTWNCCRLGARSAYTIQPCTSLQCTLCQLNPSDLWQSEDVFLVTYTKATVTHVRLRHPTVCLPIAVRTHTSLSPK